MLYTEFDYFTSVYFLFNSIALIGMFIHPEWEIKKILQALVTFFQEIRKWSWFSPLSSLLVHCNPNKNNLFLGVALFSMCYFILQEEISHKAMEASRRARKSISKYSHTIMQHSRSDWPISLKKFCNLERPGLVEILLFLRVVAPLKRTSKECGSAVSQPRLWPSPFLLVIVVIRPLIVSSLSE